MVRNVPRSSPRFTLTGLFIFVTLAALVLALGRWIGFVAAFCFLLFPVPPLAYLALVRYGMSESRADYQHRSQTFNWMLMGGLAFSVFVSLLLLAIAIDSLRYEWIDSIDPLRGLKG